MGAWGEAPYANDSAADWFCDSRGLKTLAKEVQEVFNDDNRDASELRAACFVLAKLGYGYVWNVYTLDEQLEQGIELLTELRENKQWVNGWSEPEKIVASLNGQIQELQSRLNREDEETLLRKIAELK